MKKLIALCLVISFLVMNCATYEKGEGINLELGQRPGAKLVIQKIGGQQVIGELIAVKYDSLLFKESESGADMSVELSNIETIKIVKKSTALMGAGIGLLAGSIIGYSVYKALEVTDPTLDFTLYATGLGAILGIIILGSFGALSGVDKTIQLEGKSDSEIQNILEDLRKKARVSKFQ